MVVYVLVHHCDTPDVEDLDVLGVYGEEHFDEAHADMIADRDRVIDEFKSIWPDWEWDADMCNESETYVSLGKMGQGFCPDTIYSWEIHERDVQ